MAPEWRRPVIGIGTDLVEVERFRRALARTPRLAERVFTDVERADAGRRRDPTEMLAARFAAKEAVMKALGVGLGRFPLHDVEVVKASSGPPRWRCTARPPRSPASGASPIGASPSPTRTRWPKPWPWRCSSKGPVTPLRTSPAAAGDGSRADGW